MPTVYIIISFRTVPDVSGHLATIHCVCVCKGCCCIAISRVHVQVLRLLLALRQLLIKVANLMSKVCYTYLRTLLFCAKVVFTNVNKFIAKLHM